jgi:hypothetical protein
MNSTRRSSQKFGQSDIEEAMERFAEHREPSYVQASSGAKLAGIFLVFLVLVIASFDTNAQLPDPGMQIDSLRTTEEATAAIRSTR